MEFYLIDHEATLEDIEKFHFPNQKVGVIAHIETLDGKKFYYNNEELNLVMRMVFLKILVVK